MTEFWDWAVATYARPGVAEACLYLQDAHSQNVPLLLWAVWRTGQGRGVDATAAAAIARAWENDVIAPLRDVRRRLKAPVNEGDDADRLAARERVKGAELAAERALMCQLARVDGNGAPADNLRAVAMAWNARVPETELAQLQALITAA